MSRPAKDPAGQAGERTVLAAPMEGITGYIWRNVHHKHFGGIACYYMPFLVPTQTHRFQARELKDVIPEHNAGVPVVPQLMSNHAEHFLWAAKQLREYGYRELNLNLGCPSGTVVPKRRGSGFLACPEELDRFLERAVTGLDALSMSLSVKTRLGLVSPEEFAEILSVFNRYPLKLVIVHPRVRTDFYKNPVRLSGWEEALAESKNPLCYNGDLFSAEDVGRFTGRYPGSGCIMLGRGLIANPALAEEVLGLGKLTKGRLRAFYEELMLCFREVLPGEKSLVFKCKEFWYYMGGCFEGYEEREKHIRRAKSYAELSAKAARIFDELEFSPSPGFWSCEHTAGF